VSVRGEYEASEENLIAFATGEGQIVRMTDIQRFLRYRIFLRQ